ncbi:sulfite exporter TauE/SafE family protein [Neoroseomonas rubea]|uniref:sulfite exporter TauE/SafE family protein n=1 Tax=Neoroseomonas rubea TaxID=2748666 RepID=UPI002FCD2B18
MTALIDAAWPVLADWRLAGAIVATIVAGVMRGYSGFGTAVILAPVYSLLWGPRAGVPIMLLMELLVSVQLLPGALKDADRRVVLPLGGAAALATPLGAWILFTADGESLRRFIGGFVLVFGLLLMSGWRYRGSRPLPLNLFVGTLAGLLKGSTGMSGPPVILYLLAGLEEAKRHRANLILFFATIAVVSVVPPLLGGLIDLPVLLRLAVLLPIMAISVPIGARLFHVIPDRLYRPFAMAVLLGAGGLALFG